MAYKDKNKEKALRKTYYIKNKENILEKRKNYRLLHREEINRKKLEAYYKNPCKLILSNIKRRCNNPTCKDYKWYGEREIKCLITLQEIEILWKRDKAYLMRRPNIDRIDNNGSYTFNNCHFIEQSIHINKSIKRKPISQYNLKGDFIKDFNSISEAARITNQDISSIIDCLKGRHKQNKGFIWKYK